MQYFPGTATSTQQAAPEGAGRVRDWGPRGYRNPLLPTIPLGSGAYSFHNAETLEAMAIAGSYYGAPDWRLGPLGFGSPPGGGNFSFGFDWGIPPVGVGTAPSGGGSMYGGGSAYGGGGGGAVAPYLPPMGVPPAVANNTVSGVGILESPSKQVVNLWMLARNPMMLWNRRNMLPHNLLDSPTHLDTLTAAPGDPGAIIYSSMNDAWERLPPPNPADTPAEAITLLGAGPVWMYLCEYAGDANHYAYTLEPNSGTSRFLHINKETTTDELVKADSGGTAGYLDATIVDLGVGMTHWIDVVTVSHQIQISHKDPQALASFVTLASASTLRFDAKGHFIEAI